jgi:hypothetical protein
MEKMMIRLFEKKINISDAEDFVFLLYRAALGRDPDQEILSVLPAMIKTHSDKLKIFDSVISSDEFRKKSHYAEEDRRIAEHFMDALFASRSDIKFVQVGVNDAKNADFIRGRAIQNDWRGLMIEPHPMYIDEAKKIMAAVWT